MKKLFSDRLPDMLLAGMLTVALVQALAPSGTASPAVATAGIPASYLLNPTETLPGLEPALFQAMRTEGRLVVGIHTAQPGDTLASLARLYGTTEDSLRSTNYLKNTTLTPGQNIVVINRSGMMAVVARDRKDRHVQTLTEIAKTWGQNAAVVMRANRLPGVALLTTEGLPLGTEVFLPGARLRFVDYIFPIPGGSVRGLLSSRFGRRMHPVLGRRLFHAGIDLRSPMGAPVRASRDGVVRFTGEHGGLGQAIFIRHAGGMETWYGHLSQIRVVVGQAVVKGQLIGNVGATGLATGPHLHFEVHDARGRPMNPREFLP